MDGCMQGDVNSCVVYSNYHRFDDRAKSFVGAQKACKLKDINSCLDIAKVYELGLVSKDNRVIVKRDHNRAKKYFAMTCNYAISDNLDTMYELEACLNYLIINNTSKYHN
jgi:TPR repeat protein